MRLKTALMAAALLGPAPAGAQSLETSLYAYGGGIVPLSKAYVQTAGGTTITCKRR